MLFFFDLKDKIRKYSSGINLIQRISDTVICLIILTYGIQSFLEINFYIYSFILYLIISWSLRELYGSFRSNTSNYILNEVFASSLLIILAFLSLNFILLSNTNYVISISIIKSLILFLYLILSHAISRIFLRIYRINGGNKRSILLLSDKYIKEKITTELKEYPWMGYKITNWFSHSDDHDCWDIEPQGNFDDMKLWLKTNNPDLIIFSRDEKFVSMEELLNYFGDTSFTVCYVENWFNSTMNIRSINLGNTKLITLWGSSQSLILYFFKEIFDKVFALILIALLSPILILLATFISLSTKQSFLYKQIRVGKDGKLFQIYKFRTMVVNDSGNQKVLRQATEKDKRVTPIGSFLRSYSLDELPQIFNVLNGSMSLVGPRPHAVSHNNFYRMKIRGYMQRHKAKPGITGLAQIKGLRGETKTIEEMEKRIKVDLDYINNWSLLLDLKILLKTFLNFKSKKAY